MTRREKEECEMIPKSLAQATGRLVAPIVQRNRFKEDNELSLKHSEFHVDMEYPGAEANGQTDTQAWRSGDHNCGSWAQTR